MQAFKEFVGMDTSFWAFIKFISETLGYTERKKNIVKSYSVSEITKLCKDKQICTDAETIIRAVQYIETRANSLNNFARDMLMDSEMANKIYNNLHILHSKECYNCKIPFNKQKGDMKQVAYFTAIINILAEKVIRENMLPTNELGFDDDPRGLIYIWDENKNLIGASSRRFDGAYPSIANPKMVWEIKEYYYATTFGSRVADAVYETQLDGFEFKEIFDRTGRKIFHVLFIDAYRTWWIQGKSYLCRIVDALNAGLVDEVIVGKEVLTRWPALLKSKVR